MANSDHVALREFVETIIAAEMRLRDILRAEDRRWVEDQFKAIAKALELEAAELARRLEGLNGEQARIARSQATYVSREIWDATVNEWVTWRSKNDTNVQDKVGRTEFQVYKETTDRALTLKAGEAQGMSKTTAILFSVISATAAVAGITGVVYGLTH